MYSLTALISIIFLIQRIQAHTRLVLLDNVEITFQNRGKQTDFSIVTPFGNGISADNAWIGIGFNDYPNMMSGASVVVCKNTPKMNVVEHYYNSGKRSNPINLKNRSIGISNAQVNVVNNYMNCTYTRDNAVNNELYFDTNEYIPYIIVAYGRGPYNIHVTYDSSSDLVNFPVEIEVMTATTPETTTTPESTTTTETTTHKKTKATRQKISTTKTTEATTTIPIPTSTNETMIDPPLETLMIPLTTTTLITKTKASTAKTTKKTTTKKKNQTITTTTTTKKKTTTAKKTIVAATLLKA